MKYSEFLRKVAAHIVTQEEFNTLVQDKSSTLESERFFYSSWICNTISGREDEYSVKLRKTIKRKIENKAGKGSTATFTALFVQSFDPEANKQYRINWLLTLAAIYESKGK